MTDRDELKEAATGATIRLSLGTDALAVLERRYEALSTVQHDALVRATDGFAQSKGDRVAFAKNAIEFLKMAAVVGLV